MKGTISQYFKLGQEGKYRVYINQYTTNTVALNKHQHREASSACPHVKIFSLQVFPFFIKTPVTMIGVNLR